MKRYQLYVIFSCVLLTAAGSASAQNFSASDAVEATANGTINWTTGEVYATGIGAPPANAMSAAQARAMAERAAQVVAYRNLLETVKGVRVDSETLVENFMTRSDVIRTAVSGIVRGARIVRTQYMSDGSVEVLVAMPMKGALMDTIVPENFGRPATGLGTYRPYPAPQKPDIKPAPPARKAEPVQPVPQPPPPAPERKVEPAKPVPQPPAPVPSAGEPPAAFKGGVATGLVIDGRGLGLRPALLPRIIDPQGQEIYVGQVVTRTNAVEQGVAGYARDVHAAANNFRVTDNPVVIKGLRASGAARTDVAIGQADAQTLRQLSTKGDFLQYCRVIIVY